LLALPIANCGLRLSDEAVRVPVGLRLGLSLCIPRTCQCGVEVDALGSHAMVRGLRAKPQDITHLLMSFGEP